MFESVSKCDGKPAGFTRRSLLLRSASAAAFIILRPLGKSGNMQAMPKDSPQEVVIVEFTDAGEQLKKEIVPKVIKTEVEWQKQLSQSAFRITRHAGTELAFSGKLWSRHEKGIYRCICCGNALFSSDTKFDSGTGWPSFWAPIASENIRASRDSSLGMIRTAVSCAECDAHLGHVFDDGPPPTHLRYCMNSESLRFIAYKSGEVSRR
jgi:peptide-methionine (R)-S-oxide reductase